MKKILLLLLPILIISYYYIIPNKAFTTEEIKTIEKIIIPKYLTVKELIKVKGAEYNVSPKLMEEIINCESHGSTTIQSTHIYKNSKYGKVGTR